MIKEVYKLEGDAYEINEVREVFLTKESAYEASKEWAPFLGVDDIGEAYDNDEIRIVNVKVR